MDKRLALAICQGYVKDYTATEYIHAWQTIIDNGDAWRKQHKEGYSLGREASARIGYGYNIPAEEAVVPALSRPEPTPVETVQIGKKTYPVVQEGEIVFHEQLAAERRNSLIDKEDEHLIKHAGILDESLAFHRVE